MISSFPLGRRVLYIDEKNDWRATTSSTGRAHDRVEQPEHFREAGAALGSFSEGCAIFRQTGSWRRFRIIRKRFYAFVASVDHDRPGRVRELERDHFL